MSLWLIPAGIVGILVVLRIVTHFTRWGMVDRSREDVAQYIEGFLNGRIDYREWDEFVSCGIKDRDLDRIREECIGLESNRFALQAMLDEVRGRAA